MTPNAVIAPRRDVTSVMSLSNFLPCSKSCKGWKSVALAFLRGGFLAPKCWRENKLDVLHACTSGPDILSKSSTGPKRFYDDTIENTTTLHLQLLLLMLNKTSMKISPEFHPK